MTERKPPGLSWESWIDRQVREAQERGEFDGLPGYGKPIADLDKPYDEQWWVRRKLRDEGVSYLPPSLALRKEAEVALEAAHRAPTEAHVRRIVDELNTKIRAAIRLPPAGPPLNLFPYDVDLVVAGWRAARTGEAGAGEAGAGDRAAGPGDGATGPGEAGAGPAEGRAEAGRADSGRRRRGATSSERDAAPAGAVAGPGESDAEASEGGARRRLRGGARRRRRGPRRGGADDGARGQAGG